MSLCISVEKKSAGKIIELLRKMNIIDRSRKIASKGDKVLIPVSHVPSDIIQFHEIGIEECPPLSRMTLNPKIPSLDVLKDIVIIRANALNNIDPNILVKNILNIYPNTRSIFIKKGTIGEYRIPLLELLWGEPVEEVVVKEYGFLFKVRLREVYFNPRLSEEHHRIACMVKNGEVVADLFAGIGGFSIHIAEKSSLVIANDMNPVAYDLLVENIKLNKKRLKGTIIPLNMDTRNVDQVLQNMRVDRIIANIPISSLNFHEVYKSILKPGGILHLYVLSSELNIVLKDITSIFANWKIVGARRVLDHSPGTYIFRIDLIKPQ
ncbi:MAG: methyltransferase [Desulfurococcaceae archaeon]